MHGNWTKVIIRTLVSVAACCHLAHAQPTTPTVLEIDVNNLVFYGLDSVDQTRLASDPNSTQPPPPLGFRTAVSIGDIVAVNGSPAKGLYVSRLWTLTLTPTPTRGQAIADVTRAAAYDATIEILQPDGTPIGTIMAAGFSGGPPAPGSPAAFAGWNSTVTGGTGYFIGARGTAGVGVTSAPVRNASITEDPANRRQHGGGTRRYVVSVIPMSRPAVMMMQSAPAIFHSDLSPVTPARPARPGEALILMATGLGPTNPGVDQGAPFPLERLHAVNTPLEVTVNNNRSDVINQVGWPGLVDTYRIDFRVPEATPGGIATIQLTAAWVKSPEVRFPVQ